MNSHRTEMTEEQKLDLLISIQESSSSKQWSDGLKEKILKQILDKDFKNVVKQAWANQQLKEIESDPLEEKVVDESGKCLANRAWKCQARNCRYQPFRGNCLQLAIEVTKEDHFKLTGKSTTKFACLKHYRVQGQEINYCHNYFKLHKRLPEGAYLKLNIQDPSVQVPKPSTSAATNTKGGELDTVVHESQKEERPSSPQASTSHQGIENNSQQQML